MDLLKREPLAPSKTPATPNVLILLQAASVLSLGALFVALTWAYSTSFKNASATLAAEAAQHGLEQMSAMFETRLAQLKSELLYLRAQQQRVGKGAKDAERQPMLFHGRDNLAAFATATRSSSGQWILEQYTTRGRALSVDPSGLDPQSLLFSRLESLKQPGVAVFPLNARLFGTVWQGEQAIAVAFSTAQGPDRQLGLIGVFHPSYVLSFCRAFATGSINTYALDTQGRVMCHSLPRFEGVNFKDYLVTPGEQRRYTNTAGTDVVAMSGKPDGSDVVVVAEAQVKTRAPLSGSVWAISLGLGLMILLNIVVTGLAIRRRGPKSEVKELEDMVLSIQSSRAFVASYQKQVMELPASADVVQFTLAYLCSWNSDGAGFAMRAAWLPFSEPANELHVASAAGWPELEKKNLRFKLDTPNDPGLKGKLEACAGCSSIRLQPVYFIEDLLGIFAIAGLPEDGTVTEYLESMPQIGQVFGMIVKLRQFKESTL